MRNYLTICLCSCLLCGLRLAHAQGLPTQPINGSTIEKQYVPGAEERRKALQVIYVDVYVAIQAKDTAKAHTLLRKAIDQYRDQGTANLILAELLMDERQYKEAVDVYRDHVYERPDKKWHGVNSKDIDVRMQFAYALSKTGNKWEAWDVYRSAVGSASDEVKQLLTAQLALLNDRGNYDVSLLRATVLTIYARTFPGRTGLDKQGVRRMLDRNPDVITALDFALKERPRFAPALYLLGNVYAEQKNIEKAQKNWKDAIENDHSSDGIIKAALVGKVR